MRPLLRAARALARPLETLERRDVPTAFRSIDGFGNNISHPLWGTTNSDFLRVAPADYTNGVDAPPGASRPGARAVSNGIVDHPEGDLKNGRALSAFIYAWGQFIDHDLDLTNTAAGAGSMAIPVPAGDPQFDPNNTGTQSIPLTRSQYHAGVTSPRMQFNAITSFLDGSMVYGSTAAVAASLRTMVNGRMKTDAGNLLPDDPAAPGFFLAGDVRVNENPELTSIQTLFVREHNRLAGQLKQQNPWWNDEKLFQEARRRVIAEIEAITFNEFLPALLGPNAMPGYQGYNPIVNPTITAEFAAAAFRFGHSMVGNDIEFLDNNGEEVAPELELADAFFNPQVVRDNDIDPILKYLASDLAEEVDSVIVDGLRNFLFGPPGAGGFDLAALNIQRGRDHGINDYNDVRFAYGLPKVTSFAQISSNPLVQQKLAQLYGNVNNIDLWVGGLAEDHLPGGSLGPTFTRIVARQFDRLRTGDRFWYEKDFAGTSELFSLRGTRLADVIKRNTELTNLQTNVFFFNTTIGGTIFRDADHNGHRNFGEQGLPGIHVDLWDDTGAVVDSTITGFDGRYAFRDVGLGTFTVHVVVPPGQQITTPPPPPVHITRGMEVGGINFGLYGNMMPPPGPGPWSEMTFGNKGMALIELG